MKTRLLIASILLACLGISSGLIAQKTIQQTSENAVLVVLKSGIELKGFVSEWMYGEYLIMSTEWQDEIRFEQSEIEKVYQLDKVSASTKENKRKERVYNFEEKGRYYTLKGQFITGNNGSRAANVNGFGFSASAGYRFNRLIGAGIGFGYDQFIWNSGEELIPLFAEATGFISPELTTAFYNVQLGYSFALSNDRYLIRESKGGFMIYPAIGIRFGAKKKKLTLDLGYKFQNAEFTYEDSWTPTTISEQDISYKRLTLRFGILM